MATIITDEMRREWEAFIREHPPYTDEEIDNISEWELDGDRVIANMLQHSLDELDGKE